MTDSQRWFTFIIVCLVGGLIYLLAPILVPFLIAGLLAYFLNPVINQMTKWHIPRVLAIVIIFIVLVLILLISILFLVPMVENQVIALIKTIPQINQWLTKSVLPWFNQYFHLKETINLNVLENQLLSQVNMSGSVVAKVWQTVSHSSIALISFISTVILVPVVMFYLLIDWVKITKAASRLLPRKEEQDIISLIKECGDILGCFLRGQLLVMMSQGFVYAIGSWLVGLNVGILVGFIAGLLSIVPYLGFIVGILIALTAGFIQFSSWWPLFWIVIVFSIGALSESLIFTPWFVGDRVGIHPVAIIFVVLAGGQLFGFAGVLLAVPVSAVLMVFLRHLKSYYFKTEYYKTKK